MFWATIWALVLGFGLSGAVQAFVSRRTCSAALVNHRPAAVARATRATAWSPRRARTRRRRWRSRSSRKGADFVTSMVFMFASTNLVVELGIVLVVLIGWQFALARVRRRRDHDRRSSRSLAAARACRGERDSTRARAARRRRRTRRRRAESSGGRGGERLRRTAGWADAASYTMADLTMLRREMAIGYPVAGFLAVLVPVHVWNDVFISGHGFWTTLENVSSGRSSRSSATSARSATSRSPPRSGTAGSASAA